MERFRNSGEHTLPRKPEPAWPSKAKNKSVFLTLTHEGIKLVMMIVMEGFFFFLDLNPVLIGKNITKKHRFCLNM